MNDEAYEEFSKGLKPAVLSILTELSGDAENESVAMDVLCLEVKRKFPKVEFVSICDSVYQLLRTNQIESHGYDCKLSVLDALAALGL